MENLSAKNFDINAKVTYFDRERLKWQAKKERRGKGAIVRDALLFYLNQEEQKSAS
ncbi:MAG: hypothetical protein KME30_32590 [Iphinoe sp. HA4291-MV1]|nr:hypothetical protein [Iphinoe sp. HA4291-MV1]